VRDRLPGELLAAEEAHALEVPSRRSTPPADRPSTWSDLRVA
jgi:hypothetical protein